MRFAGGEEIARFLKIAGDREAERVEDGDYSARGFGNGGVIEEQGLPDQVGLRELASAKYSAGVMLEERKSSASR